MIAPLFPALDEGQDDDDNDYTRDDNEECGHGPVHAMTSIAHRQSQAGSSTPVPFQASAGPSEPTPLHDQNSHIVNRRFDASASIALVGVPGAGKRSLAFIAATHLKRRLCTENAYFEAAVGMTKAAFLEQHGSKVLVSRSLQLLEQMLHNNASDCVVECGATTLTPAARRILKAYASDHPVINITRDQHDIAQSRRLPSLSAFDSRALQHVDADFAHRLCSNFDFFNLFDHTTTATASTAAGVPSPVHHSVADQAVDDDNVGPSGTTTPSSSPLVLRQLKVEFCNFLDIILGRNLVGDCDPFYSSRVPVIHKHRSFAAVWPLSDFLAQTSSTDPTVLQGLDAIELRIDCWPRGAETIVSRQVAVIRRTTGLSIIISVEQQTHKLSPSEQRLAMAYALRTGPDCIVINGSSPRDMQLRLLASKGHAASICDFTSHDTQRSDAHFWLEHTRVGQYMSARNMGFDVVRQTQSAVTATDNVHLLYFHSQLERNGHETRIPLIAYNTGMVGRSSKVHNTILTPVVPYHPYQDHSDHHGAHEHLTIDQITRALFADFVYDSLHFFVFSSSSPDFSLSPAMYRSAFDLYGLQHAVNYQQVVSLPDLMAWAHRPFFGGAAITFPFKDAALTACNKLSSHAAAIGSVNSIMPVRNLGKSDSEDDLGAQAAERNKQRPIVGIYGDNTVWIAFFRTLQQHISPRNAVLNGRQSALVLGAGGSARAAIYALIQLGYQHIFIRNRTEGKAVSLAEHFTTWSRSVDRRDIRINVLRPESIHWPRDVALPTVIVACVPTNHSLHLPDDWFDSPTGGVITEISCSIKQSVLLDQVNAKAKSTELRWSIIHGLDVLLEAAVVQFEFFTGYRAPREAMARALRDSKRQTNS